MFSQLQDVCKLRLNQEKPTTLVGIMSLRMLERFIESLVSMSYVTR